MSESSGHEYLRSHQLSGDVLLLDLEQESRAILEAARAAPVGRAAKTLVKDGPLRLVILGFMAGSSLREHSAGGPFSIQALSGRVEVTASGRSEAVEAGRVLVFSAAVPHSLTARVDAVLLLTIAWAEQQ